MARGLGLANLLTDDTARRDGVVAQWARLLDGVLGADKTDQSKLPRL